LTPPRPPTSTLFPYTTLFRSHYFKYNDEFLLLPVAFFYFTGIQRYLAVAEGKAEWVRVAYTRNIFSPMTDEKAMEAMFLFAMGTDRKSTRLNSSHVKISYAVF